MIATIDKFAYEKSYLINIGDEKGELLDNAVRRADPRWRWNWARMRIQLVADRPGGAGAKVFSVELAAANAQLARRIWAHAGVTTE